MMQVEQAKRWFRTKGTCFQSHTSQRFQIAGVAAADSEAPASDDSEELFYPFSTCDPFISGKPILGGEGKSMLEIHCPPGRKLSMGNECG